MGGVAVDWFVLFEQASAAGLVGTDGAELSGGAPATVVTGAAAVAPGAGAVGLGAAVGGAAWWITAWRPAPPAIELGGAAVVGAAVVGAAVVGAAVAPGANVVVAPGGDVVVAPGTVVGTGARGASLPAYVLMTGRKRSSPVWPTMLSARS